MATVIQLRGDTAANWAAANPILADREFVVETDTGKYKIGNGVNNYNALPYKSFPSTVYTKDEMDALLILRTAVTVTEANELTEAEAIAKLFKEVDGIKALLAKLVTGEAWIDKLLIMSELNLFGSTNLIIKATAAPVPDFIGQIFINTTSAPYPGYIAIGTTSVSDWKQITN
jgi:hypothetical protein